jgi:phosphatidate cytidylyltransferase
MPLSALIGPGCFLLWFGLVAVGFLVLVFFLNKRRARAASARAILPIGALALPALFSCIVYLRLLDGASVSVMRVALPSGACWLFLVFAACWAMDTAAYAVGKKWGKRKLCPAISPGKTVEGSVAGLLAAVVVVAVFGRVLGLGAHFGVVLGALLGIVGQLGDLTESRLKRWAGVKDSGAILPGHGGVLDRFDSLLFCAPMAYCYLRFVVGG